MENRLGGRLNRYRASDVIQTIHYLLHTKHNESGYFVELSSRDDANPFMQMKLQAEENPMSFMSSIVGDNPNLTPYYFEDGENHRYEFSNRETISRSNPSKRNIFFSTVQKPGKNGITVEVDINGQKLYRYDFIACYVVQNSQIFPGIQLKAFEGSNKNNLEEGKSLYFLVPNQAPIEPQA